MSNSSGMSPNSDNQEPVSHLRDDEMEGLEAAPPADPNMLDDVDSCFISSIHSTFQKLSIQLLA